MESRHSTFSAKIRTLTDYYHRTLNQQQPPSGLEIVNILRYFQQTLLGFLKDVQNVPTDTFRLQNSGLARCSLFPNLNYSGLYFALNNLIDAYQLVPSGQIALGHSILNTIKCVYLFLERDVIDQMPYNVACLLSCFPKQLHQEVMQLLCDCVLPFCLNGELSELHYAILSVPAVLMLVFQYTNEPCHHTYLLETLMSLRQDVYKEVLGVIASGTSESRVPSANLLFHYWPLLNPHILDRKPIQYKAHAWTPSRCQHKECSITAGGSQSATASGSKSSPTDYFTAAASPSPVDSSPACYSIKKCFDPIVCCEVAESAPPVLLCKQCADKIVEDYSKVSLYYICQPMPTSNVNVCQNKGCQSGSRLAVSTCFSEDCIRAHQHVPIRLCQECHNTFHVEGNATPEVAAAATSTDPHIFHTRLPCPWTTPDPKTCRDTVEAVVKLLKETSTMLELCDQEGKRPKWLRKLEAGQAVGQEIDEMADEKRMLSRYGIWILAGLCTPSDQAPPECIGYLMSMLFQWFSTTALLPNDPMGSALEQLKTDFVLDWLTSAIGLFYDVFVQCLMPKPPEYGKSGGQWDKLTTRTEQIKEGLNKMLALMPYDVVSLQTWDTIMPEWLEAICNEAPEKDLPELRVNLCKVFEPDLCPLALSVNQMYRFIGIRLEDGDYGDMQKALDWIQLLCEMEIDLPLPVLLHFLTTAVKRMHDMEIYGDGNMKASEPERPPPPVVNPIIVSRVDSIGDHEGLFDDENEGAVSALTPQDSPIRKPPLPGAMMMEAEIGESNGAFYANMLDIITRQIEFSEIPKHEGVSSENTQLILKALTCIVGAPWKGTHTCDQPDTDEFVDCSYCQETLIFHEILMELVQRVCPKKEMRIEMLADDDYDWEPPEPEDAPEPTETKDMIHQSVSRTATTTLEMSGGLEAKQSTAIQIDVETGEMVLPLQQVQAAEYEEAEELEFVAALPSEEIETAMARATTLTETDVGLATCQITSATLVEGKGAESAVVEPPLTPSKANFWYTSLGKFRFTLEELPAQLQLIYALMIDVERHPDPDVIYCLLHSMKYLCLHAEALSTAHREHRGFLIWAQENLLIPKLWHMLRSDYSQIAEICVPLIFHCLTLPSGADMFWSVTNEDFMSEDWTIRFAAVEKVSLILMFIDPAPLRNNLLLQGALANAFSFLIVAVQDPNCAIAQRALMIIEDMKPTGLKCLLSCLEAQFDSAVMDRALILHRLHLLTCLLPEQPFLTWEFFLQRFDTLAVEAQLQVAARTGEIAFAQDLLHSDPMSDLYQRKISRARQSLEQIDNVRSMARLMDGAMKYQASVSLKRSVKMEEARLAAKRRQRANDNEKAQMRERAETQSGRDPCKCPKRGWHRCSLENPEAVQARNKVRKVILMVKVMQAWKGMRRRMSAISIGTISTISVMSSLLGTTASAPNTVSNPEVTSTVLKAARAFSSHRYSAPEPVEDSDSDVPPTLVQNYQPKKSFAHFYERELPGQLGPQYGMSETADHALGKLREFTDQESNFCLLLNRAIDSETSERHTMYLTLVLFMQFLSSKKTALVNPDEKAAAKKQSIVMRHLNTLLGYSNTERCFTIPPYKLRSSAICSAFLTGLPAVLDNNRFIGNQILPIALQLLQYMPSPQKFASDNQPITYSLWALDTQSRSSWLWVVLLVLYKYRFDQPPLDDTMVNLVKLILNTLEAQVHVCATVDASAHSPIFQSGDYNLGGYFNESGRSSAARKAASLRHVFNTVLLMVKVMRSWPRGHQRLAEKLSSVSILSSASTISSAGMRSASPVEMDSSSASDVEVSDAELGPTTETQMRSQHKEKKRLGVHRKKRKKRGHKRHETQTIDESEETLLVPTIDSRHRHKPEGLRLRSPKHSPPGSPVQVRRHPVQAPGERVETRIRQQIDEFDRSFVKLDSPVSPQMVTAVPTVVVTPGEPQLVRPEMLQVSAASQHLVTADSHEVHPQVTQVRPMIEQKPTVIEPGTSQSVEVFTISPLASVTTSASQQVHQVLPSLTGNLMSLDAQVLQSPETVRLEAIGEDNDGFLGSGLKGTSGSEDRKTGLKSLLQLTPSQRRKHRLAEIGRQSSAHTVPSAAPGNTTKQTSDATMVLRCTQCDQALENYDEDTIALAVVCLSTFVHREPGMAAPHLPRILEVVAHVAHHVYFPWQAETSVFVPGNCRSVARQFLRVVSHQLAPNGLFLQLFQTQITVPTFFKTLSSSLMDFQELNPVSVLQFLLEGMNSNWPTRMHRLLFNFANYITTIPLDQYLPVWNTVAGLLDLVCIRRYLTEVSQAALSADIDSWVIIINSIFRVQNFSSLKSSVGLLESLTKLVSQALQQAPVKLQDLLTICTACNRAFIRERDRQALSRACVNELLQAVKFKSTLPEQNYVVLLNLVLQDSGETVSADVDEHLYNTCAAECARPFIQDFVDFIADLHVLNKVKNLARGLGFREDTLGGDLKAGLSQYVAVEISKGSVRDPRTVLRYLPWLLSPPSVTQQGPTEFVECVAHVRVLSWILLGALHSTGTATCLPIPIESSQHIADQIQFVLAGFAEQSKESVIHMSALFHAFHLCQLWTAYCEQASSSHPDSDLGYQALANVMDFWARITPAVLQLLSHSKVLADMVNLHFLNTIEALQECQSAILCQLYPMWHPILSAYHLRVPSQLKVRLDAYENSILKDDNQLEPWLKRVRFKISQVELQSSAATQFYSV